MIQRGTCKQVVKEVTDRLGVDYLDTNFSLFSKNDQEAEQYLSLLLTSVQEVAQDLFPKKIGLEQKVTEVKVLQAPEQSITGIVWLYNYLTVNCFRIYKVYAGTLELTPVYNLEDLKDNNYIVGVVNIKTSQRYPKLKILYTPNTFYVSKLENILTAVQTPLGDEDIIVLDKELVINKLGYLFALKRGLIEEGNLCMQRYEKRLLALKEQLFEGASKIRL